MVLILVIIISLLVFYLYNKEHFNVFNQHKLYMDLRNKIDTNKIDNNKMSLYNDSVSIYLC